MITLEEARADYYTLSGKLSDVSRQLSFAGIAVVWIFRAGDKAAAGIAWNRFLLWPLAFFVTALIFDLLHYGYSTAAWGIYSRRKEKEFQGLREQKGGEVDESFEAPAWINWTALVFFWLKAIAAAVGHVLLLGFLGTVLWK